MVVDLIRGSSADAARLTLRTVNKRIAPSVLKVLDYATYGGAPLLGVQGVSIICHGSSPAPAIKNAIDVALKAVESHVAQDIGAEFAQGGAVA